MLVGLAATSVLVAHGLRAGWLVPALAAMMTAVSLRRDASS
jgi:hypothetical protein